MFSEDFMIIEVSYRWVLLGVTLQVAQQDHKTHTHMHARTHTTQILGYFSPSVQFIKEMSPFLSLY